MKLQEVLKELEQLGSPSIKSVLIKHGATEPFFGVKVEDLKKVQKKIRNDHSLSLKLYNTGNSDAMYLAGLVADGKRMSVEELDGWAERAPWQMISEYTVPWVASENENGWELAMKWIDSEKETVASSGWSTLAAIVSMKDDSQLNIESIRKLMHRIETTIHSEQNRVRYTMNGFLMSVGIYIESLSNEAIAFSERIGKVEVNLGKTACKVPFAPEYIKKAIEKGQLGKKRKTVRC